MLAMCMTGGYKGVEVGCVCWIFCCRSAWRDAKHAASRQDCCEAPATAKGLSGANAAHESPSASAAWFHSFLNSQQARPVSHSVQHQSLCIPSFVCMRGCSCREVQRDCTLVGCGLIMLNALRCFRCPGRNAKTSFAVSRLATSWQHSFRLKQTLSSCVSHFKQAMLRAVKRPRGCRTSQAVLDSEFESNIASRDRSFVVADGRTITHVRVATGRLLFKVLQLNHRIFRGGRSLHANEG